MTKLKYKVLSDLCGPSTLFLCLCETFLMDSVAPIFSGVVDMDPPLSPGRQRTYDLCGTCKRTMDNEVPGIMY